MMIARSLVIFDVRGHFIFDVEGTLVDSTALTLCC
jgi:hypothetical protein